MSNKSMMLLPVVVPEVGDQLLGITPQGRAYRATVQQFSDIINRADRAAAFTPLSPASVPGLTAWYDFADGDSLIVSDAIDAIVNKANPGTYDGANTGTARPTLATGLGGNTVGRFDGSQRLLTDDIDLGTEYTVLAVFDMARTGLFNLILGKPGNYFGGGNGGNRWVGNANSKGLVYDDQGYGVKIYTLARDGAEKFFGLDGCPFGRVPTTDDVLETDACVTGNIGGYAYSFTGDMGELLIFDRRLEDAEIRRLETYLANKWGLADELPVAMVFDGNSITNGNGTTNIANDPDADTAYTDYPSRVRQELGWTDAVWLNLGVAGQTTLQMAADASTDVDILYSPHRADNILAVAEITNDFVNNPSSTKEQLYENFVSYCQARKSAGWKVVIWGVLPRDPSGRGAEFEADRTWINAQIAANWSQFADAYVDLSTVPGLFADGDNTGVLYADGIHPNDAGALALANAVAPAVAQVRTKALPEGA